LKIKGLKTVDAIGGVATQVQKKAIYLRGKKGNAIVRGETVDGKGLGNGKEKGAYVAG